MTDLPPAPPLSDLSSVPEMPLGSAEIGVLGQYEGARPPYPDWALLALADAPVETRLTVNGAGIEVLSWGKAGDPVVVLLHGNGACAQWWSFLAPSLAQAGYRVRAMSFSGMGGSDWRETYDMAGFVAEICAVMEMDTDASTHDKPRQKPILVGHSFGGFPALMTALSQSARVGGLIMLDMSIVPPGEEWTGPPKRHVPNRIYPSLTQALARFRLAPPQECETHWALDHIARASLKQVEGGYTWRFDPFLWNQFRFTNVSGQVGELAVPTFVMRGGLSVLLGARIWDYMKGLFPAGTAFVTIPQAAHHVMLDQPLATLAALEAALAGLSILPEGPARG